MISRKNEPVFMFLCGDKLWTIIQLKYTVPMLITWMISFKIKLESNQDLCCDLLWYKNNTLNFSSEKTP